MNTTGTQELRIAEEIVSVLPAGTFMRVCSDERETIRYAVRAGGMKIQTVALSRASLRKLANDPARPVKIEYLQRELLEAVEHRGEFRYPRTIRRASCVSVERIEPKRPTPLVSSL